jgi:RNA polymerase sigma-70 factor (ECF subfamily)
MPDAEDDLISRLQRGDAAAFAALFDEHHAALRRTALAFVSTQASADEVVQDTWLAVVHGVRAFERRSSLKTWIYGILINRARTAGVREARMVALAACDDEPGRVETPSQRLLRKELAGALEAAIAGLPERQRALFVLRDALEWTPEDVRHLLAVTEPNQRVLLHRARCRLRARLDPYRAAG